VTGTGAWRACRRGLSGGYEVRGSRECLVAIDGHVHGVLTLGFWGERSGGDSRSRSSQTLFEGGSVVITAVAAMGGVRLDNRMGLAYCSRSEGRFDSDICEPREYGKSDKWGTLGGWQGIAD